MRTLDEMLLVVRRDSGLRFDAGLPGFHMYGTDICLEAEAQGLQNYVVPCFAVHNSNGLRFLPWGFWRACLHVWRTRKAQLPVHAPCVKLTAGPLPPTIKAGFRWMWGRLRPRKPGKRASFPSTLHAQLVQRCQFPTLPCL